MKCIDQMLPPMQAAAAGQPGVAGPAYGDLASTGKVQSRERAGDGDQDGQADQSNVVGGVHRHLAGKAIDASSVLQTWPRLCRLPTSGG